MDPIEYLRALRRRWALLISVVVVALAAAWLTTSVVEVGPAIRSYQATALLLSVGQINVPGVSNLDTVARLATIEPVLDRVAKDVDYEGDPASLAASVQAFADPTAGLLSITAFSRDAKEAVTIADGFVRGLLGFLRDRKAATVSREAEYLQQSMEELSQEITQLDRELATAALGTRADILRAQRDAKILAYSSLSVQYQTLISTSSQVSGLEILQDAYARPVTLQGFQPPRSRTSRMAVAGAIGLVVGIFLVLVLERLDTRIRTRDASERYFRLPVLSEIPVISKVKRDPVVTSTRPISPAADAFRLLAAGLAGRVLNGAGGKGQPSVGRRVPIVLVTSAGRWEGKSTVVANLGAAFSQVGKRVVILSCDFRQPSLHEFFGARDGLDLAEVLRNGSNGQPVLDGHIQETYLPGVLFVPSGSTSRRPSTLLTSPGMRRALEEARALGDIVLLDTPPILSASDAAHLVGEVDGVLVVARAGRTTIEQAKRTAELLEQLGAPGVGLALNASSELRAPRRGWIPIHLRRTNGSGKGRRPGTGWFRIHLRRRD